MRRLLALAVLLLASAAQADTVYWGSGFDIGCAGNFTTCNGVALDSSTSQHLFDSVVGSPTFSTTVDTAESANNRYSLGITAASNVTQYAAVPAFPEVSSLRLGCKLRVTTTGNGCKREVASFVGGGGAWSGKAAIVAMRYAFTAPSGVRYYRLEAYYGATTQLVCSGSPVNGKACTTVTDCTEIHPGEAQCAASTMAVSPAIAAGDWAQFTLTQDNASGGAGNVTVALYEGTAGLTPAVYARGSTTRLVGACTGGTNALGPCHTTSACPGGACNTLNVVYPTTVRLGVSDTTACAVAYQLDDCWVYDGTVRANVRFETLTPNGTSTGLNEWEDKGGGSTIYTSIDENERAGSGPANDATDYATSAAGLAEKRSSFALSNIPKPSTSPTPVVVIFSGIAQKNWSTAGRTFDWRFQEFDGGIDEYPGTTYQINDATNWPDDGGAADYHPLWVEPFIYHTSGDAWTTRGLTDIDTLQMEFDRVTASNTSQELRITSALAEVVVQHADPPVPTHIADRDQDGEDTVCIVGDSTWDNQDFQNTIVANLVEPTNLYFYTRGASQIGDAAAEWTQLLEGASGTYLGLTVLRGTAGRTCDIVFVSHTANFAHAAVLVDPKLPTALSGVGQAGYCEDQGGSRQGAACWCATRNPLTSNVGTPGPNTTPGYFYCLNAGAFMQTPGAQGAGCACSVNADCTYGQRTPGALHTPGVCASGFCVGHVANPAVDAPPSTRDAWVVPGCLGAAGCPAGVCARFPTRNELRALMVDLDAATNARPTPNPAATPAGASGKPIIVWVIAPQALRGDLTGSSGWDQSYPGFDMVRSVFRNYATATGGYLLDLHARMRKTFTDRKCVVSNACTDDEDQQLLLRDVVHWTAAGQREAAAAVTDCLVTGGSDGVCTGTTCTAGLVGDTCAANADCDVQRCP